MVLVSTVARAAPAERRRLKNAAGAVVCAALLLCAASGCGVKDGPAESSEPVAASVSDVTASTPAPAAPTPEPEETPENMAPDAPAFTDELAEKIAAGQASGDAAEAGAWNILERIMTETAEQGDGLTFVDAEITRLELWRSVDGLIENAGVEVWDLDYELTPNDISNLGHSALEPIDGGKLRNTSPMTVNHLVFIVRDGVRTPVDGLLRVYDTDGEEKLEESLRRYLDEAGIEYIK